MGVNVKRVPHSDINIMQDNQLMIAFCNNNEMGHTR